MAQGGEAMVRQSILKGLLILYGIYVVMIGKEIGRKEEMPEDYCSMDELKGWIIICSAIRRYIKM